MSGVTFPNVGYKLTHICKLYGNIKCTVASSAVKFQISNIKSQIFFFRFGSNL